MFTLLDLTQTKPTLHFMKIPAIAFKFQLNTKNIITDLIYMWVVKLNNSGTVMLKL